MVCRRCRPERSCRMARTKQMLPSSSRPPTAIKRQVIPLNRRLETKRQLRKTDGADEPAILRALKQPKKGVKALREIRHFQRTTDLLIPRLPFQRLVREVTHEILKERGIAEDYRWQSNALLALQVNTVDIVTKYDEAVKTFSIGSSINEARQKLLKKEAENSRGLPP
nr:Histone core domain containing protein [Haemonchus contortus]